MEIVAIVIVCVLAQLGIYSRGTWPSWVPFVMSGLVLIVAFVQIAIVSRKDKSEKAIVEKHAQIVNEIEEGKPECGTWHPCVQYITNNARSGSAQEIAVDVQDYQYQRDQEIAAINFDLSVDLKQVPRGSILIIDGAPFTIENGRLTQATINQIGLDYSGEVMVSARPDTTWFVVMVNTEGVQKAYVTDGSEGSVRFWGYIVYKCGYYPP